MIYLHVCTCCHVNISSFARYEWEYVWITCELMMNTLVHCSSPMFSFIKWDICLFNKLGKVRHIKTVYPLHSSGLPLSRANYIHASDIRLQTHTVTHTHWLIEPDFTTLLGIWWKPPVHNNECQLRGEVSTAQNRIKLIDAAWGQQLINEIVYFILLFFTIADLINLYRIRLCLFIFVVLPGIIFSLSWLLCPWMHLVP